MNYFLLNYCHYSCCYVYGFLLLCLALKTVSVDRYVFDESKICQVPREIEAISLDMPIYIREGLKRVA